ncbi:MAG: NEW3 domain-containing protein [Pyrobaculum sp.]
MTSIYRILGLVLLMGALASAQASSFGVSVSYSPPYVYPGSLLQVYITVFSVQSLSNVYVSIDSPFKVVTGSQFSISQLSAGVPYTAVAVVQVPFDARPGYYTVRVTAYTLTRSAEASVDFEVFPFDFSALLVARPSYYVAGQPVQLPVLVFNPSADYVKASVKAGGDVVRPYLNFSSTCDVVIPPRGNATCIVAFRLPEGLRPGSYNVTLTASLASLSGYAGSVTFSKVVQIAVLDVPSFNVVATPTQPLYVGVPSWLTLVVTPGSLTSLQNVTIKVLDGDGVRVLSRSTLTAPVLTQVQIPVQVLVTRQGVLYLPVEICFYSGSCARRYVELFVPYAEIVVNPTFNPPRGYPGSTFQASFVLLANYTVANVDVGLYSPFRLLAISPSKLAYLNPQTPVAVNALLEIPSDAAPGLHPVTLSVGGRNYTFYYEVKKPEFAVVANFNPPVSYPGGLVAGTVAVTAPFNAVNLTVAISSPLSVLGSSTFKIPLLPQGQPFTAYVPIRVPDDAAPGEYPVYVSVGGVNYTFYISVAAPAVSVQNVLVSPPRVLEGFPAAQVTVQILNAGPVAARNVSVTVLNATLGPSTYRVDYLPPGSPLTLTFVLDASKLGPGVYNVPVVLSYAGGSGRGVGTFEVAKKDSFDVRYVVLNAQPGSTAELVINVTNLGPETAKNVRITLMPSQVFEPHASNIADVATATVRVLGDLRPGDLATTAFLLDVSDKAAPGRYYVTLLLTWNQTNSFAPGVQYVNVAVDVRGGLDLFVVVPAVLTALLVAVGVFLAVRRRRRG